MNKPSVSKTNLAQLLVQCRNFLDTKTCIAPNLFFVQLNKNYYPVYFDILDNGKELMFFQDEDAFIRSIVHANNENPDLLFTNAVTIDFLNENTINSDLLLLNQQDLIFQNTPGYLPKIPKEEELSFITECIIRLLPVFESHTFPSFSEKKALFIKENGEVFEQNYNPIINNFPLLLSKHDVEKLMKLPSTNEHILLQLYALPNVSMVSAHDFEIRIVAKGKKFHKEITLSLESYTSLGKQCQEFLYQLLQERGNVEQIHVPSYNLWFLLKEMQPYTNIHCSRYDSIDSILDFLLQNCEERSFSDQKIGKKLLN